MHTLPRAPPRSLILLLAWLLLPQAQAVSYFIVSAPASNAQWSNGAPNSVSWTKGLLDDLVYLDVELARLSHDGVLFVARNVPASSGKLSVVPKDVPAGDDYFLIFLDATHSILYGSSQRFEISGSPPGNNNSTATVHGPTVTLSVGPQPTDVFATTFAASTNTAAACASRWRTHHLVALASVMSFCLLGGAWTVL